MAMEFTSLPPQTAPPGARGLSCRVEQLTEDSVISTSWEAAQRKDEG